MERQSIEDHGDPSSAGDDIDELSIDDGEFASVEDVGDAPSENPTIDDV